MHIPDGLLPVGQCIILGAVAAPFLALSVLSVRRSARTIALISSLTATVFSASAFSFPTIFGIRDHITLIPLTALIVGPMRTRLAVFVALVGQALFFQEGGVTTLGANTLTMGVVAPFDSSFTYRLFMGNPSRLAKSVSIFLAGLLGVVSAALATGGVVSLALGAGSPGVGAMPEVGFYPSSAVVLSVLLYFLPVAFLEGVVTSVAKRIEADKLIFRTKYEGDLKAIARMLGSDASGIIPKLPVGYSVFHLADAGELFIVAWRPTYSQP